MCHPTWPQRRLAILLSRLNANLMCWKQRNWNAYLGMQVYLAVYTVLSLNFSLFSCCICLIHQWPARDTYFNRHDLQLYPFLKTSATGEHVVEISPRLLALVVSSWICLSFQRHLFFPVQAGAEVHTPSSQFFFLDLTGCRSVATPIWTNLSSAIKGTGVRHYLASIQYLQHRESSWSRPESQLNYLTCSSTPIPAERTCSPLPRSVNHYHQDNHQDNHLDTQTIFSDKQRTTQSCQTRLDVTQGAIR